MMSEAPEYELRDRLTREPSPRTRASLYRIAKEALTNARKHSRAAHVTMTLEEWGEGFLVQIEDDGIGFEVAGRPDSPPGHLGLTSMQEGTAKRSPGLVATGKRLLLNSIPFKVINHNFLTDTF